MMSGWLLVHIVGVILLLGNAFTATFWKIRSDQDNDPLQAYRVARNIMLADWVFTVPSIVLILASGHVLAVHAGHDLLSWSWLSASYGLFILSGIIWTVALLPIQQTMIQEARLSSEQGSWTPAYQKASRRWNVYGVLATLTPIAALVLMVWKPGA